MADILDLERRAENYGEIEDESRPKGLADFLFSACDFSGRRIQERAWALKAWIPRGEPSMTGGPPGAGKSLLSQAIATGVSALDQVYGIGCEPCPVLYLTCEDDLDELQRRQEGICAMMDIDIARLSNLHLVSFRGQDARLAVKAGDQFIPAPRYHELDQMIGDLKLGLVFLDLIPDFFDGNENIRNEVNRFVKGTLGSLASRHNCAINFLYHPSRSGISDGSGLSGSTAWEGSVRSRMYLTSEDENGIRTLSRKKSNYSGKDDGFNLVWREGALWPTDKERIERKAKPLGKYAQIALDALQSIGGITPVSQGLWRDKFLDMHDTRYGCAPKDIPGTWRDAKAQLFKRDLVDGAKGDVWLVNV